MSYIKIQEPTIIEIANTFRTVAKDKNKIKGRPFLSYELYIEDERFSRSTGNTILSALRYLQIDKQGFIRDVQILDMKTYYYSSWRESYKAIKLPKLVSFTIHDELYHIKINDKFNPKTLNYSYE